MNDTSGPTTGKGDIHQGADHSAPYPVSRLAPQFSLVDLAAEIERADQAVDARVSAKLQVIAEQIRTLQVAARTILQSAHSDQLLNHARCRFHRIPGHTYHLYRDNDGGTSFSMLSATDWGGRPPKPYLGAYRLGPDGHWTAADHQHDARASEDRHLIAQLLSTPLNGE